MLHWLLKQVGLLTSKNKLSILIYHQVVTERDPMRPSEPDTAEFRWQMQLIRDYFNPLPLTEAIKLLKQGQLPANSICVTFDDGYLNNLTVAQPILQELGIPATVYIATGFSHGSNMWNDRLIDLIGNQQITEFNLAALDLPVAKVSDWASRRELAYSLIPKIKYQDYQQRSTIIDQLYADNQTSEAKPKMMTPEQVKQLSELGIEIGAHTVDHPILKSQTLAEQTRQISESKQTLESWINKPVTGFAYPNGKPDNDYTSEAVVAVAAAGFDYGVSTQWGISTPQAKWCELNRFTPWDKSSSKFHLRLIRNLLS